MSIVKDLIIPIIIIFLFIHLKCLNKENRLLKLEIDKSDRHRQYYIETLMHDLKVPAIAQLRGISLLKNGYSDNKEILANIEQSCQYSLDIISTLVNIYRFENGETNLNIEKINFSELVKECFDELSIISKDKNLTFILEKNDENTVAEADKTEIKKVIINILSTAISYSNKGGEIYVKLLSDCCDLKVVVQTKGISLSALECKNMFCAYNEKDNFTNVGQGIKLYMCKKILEWHKGNIYASTDNISENKFIFTLPRKQLTCPQMPCLCS